MAEAARALRAGISSERLMIDGPAGPLEAIVDSPGGAVTSVAVVCHPHPLHAGTMQNKVTHTLARSFVRNGALAVRFNFRGVGRSAGEYDGGDGETDDALAVAQWAASRGPGLPLCLAGFSFGSMIAVRVAGALDVAALVTVAPAIRFLRDGFVRPKCPWLVIQGLEDEVVAAEDVVSWARALESPPELLTVPGVGHFFHGALGAIRDGIDDFLRQHTDGGNPKGGGTAC